jgi:hypothetical protein
MPTTPGNPYTDLGTQRALNLVKMSFGQEGFSPATAVVAHMKVIAPLTSTGPSILARVVTESANILIVRFPHIVFAGALVQVRMENKILFGEARSCTATESEFQIEIEKHEIY